MTANDLLMQRNEDFAAHRFAASTSLMPTLGTMIIGCLDPRVDPAHVLGLELGEAAVIRNVGGRITPATLQTLAMLGAIAQGTNGLTPRGLNLVILHHTDCGITRLARSPDLLADYFGVPASDLERMAVTDAYASVKVDVVALKNTPAFSDDTIVSGFVYDVATGRIDPVVAPAPLHVARRGA